MAVASLNASLSVSGVELERDGAHPLLAYAVMEGDRLVSAGVLDPMVTGGNVRLHQRLDTIDCSWRVD